MSIRSLLAITLLGHSVLFAQRGSDGFTLQEVPGIALVKPQAWSKESTATVLEFTGYIDRSAVGHGGAGYYEFRLPSGQRRQYEVGRVIKVVEYPDPDRVLKLLDARDREKVEATIRDIEQVIARFPATRSYLAERTKKFASLLETYDSGKVKLDGQWIPRSAYLQSQASRFAKLIKEDIESASPPGSHSLEYDPKYQELLVLAKDSPAAKAMAAELESRNAQLARGERRKQILAKLEDEQLPLAGCLKLVEELRNLSPEEDPAASKVVARWADAQKKAQELAEAAKPIAEAMDQKLQGLELPEFPAFDNETVVAATGLGAKVESWKQSQPPPQLAGLITQAQAVAAMADLSSRLKAMLEGRKFLDLQELLATQSANLALLGPNTRQYLEKLGKLAGEKVQAFVTARDEARQLAEAGKLDEARAKYEEAYAIVADESVARSLEQLASAQKPGS